MIDKKRDIKSICNIFDYLYEIESKIFDKSKLKNLNERELISRYDLALKFLNYRLRNFYIIEKMNIEDVYMNEMMSILVSLNVDEREELKKFLLNLKNKKYEGKVIND